MTWSTNKRSRDTSSHAWRRQRVVILMRDRGVCHVCHLAGATEVDHIVPVSLGGTDDPSNLAAICSPCHAKKSSAEGNAARVSSKRPAERHPGLIDPGTPLLPGPSSTADGPGGRAGRESGLPRKEAGDAGEGT